MKQLVNIKKKLPGGQNENTQLIKSTFILVPTAFKKQVTPVYDYVVCVFFYLITNVPPLAMICTWIPQIYPFLLYIAIIIKIFEPKLHSFSKTETLSLQISINLQNKK